MKFKLCALLFGAFATLAVSFRASAQELTELRCRGAKDALVDAFVIDKLDEETDSLSLNFNASPRPAGADSKGLDPGTCSWIDRTVKEDEWRQIHFVVTRAQAQSIPAHLKDRNNYWSFFVVNTDRGYFEVKQHQVWPAETKQASPGMPSPAQEVSELRCRGGKDAFVIDKLAEDSDSLSLNFNASPRPAGVDSKGLDPGTCSWIDRTVKEDEWRQIHFVVTRAQAQSIPAHLKDRNNYWSFFVVNTDRGYFEVKQHQVWPAETKQETSAMPSPNESHPNTPPALPNTPPASFGGKWNMASGPGSTQFTLSLQQAGSKVTGTFSPQDGTIEGTVTGKTLSFQWTQAGGYKGRGQLEMNSDGKSMTGVFTIVEGPKKGENKVSGTRAEDAPQPAPQPSTPPASFAGTWDTVAGGEYKYTMKLQQAGDKVTGTFAPGSGKLEDTVQANVLRVHFTQNQKFKGSARLVLADDGKTFSGATNAGDDPDANGQDWNGSRQSTSSIPARLLRSNFAGRWEIVSNGTKSM